MEIKTFESIEKDYYLNSPSFVKTIVDSLPEGMISEEKKQIVKMLYNYYMNRFDKEKVDEVINASVKYEDKAIASDYETLSRYTNYMYEFFIDSFVKDSYHRVEIFDVMLKNISLYVGSYQAQREEFKYTFSEVKSATRR